MQDYLPDLLKRLAAVLRPQPMQVDGTRLCKRRKELQAWSYVFPSDRRVPTMINVSEYALRPITALAMCRTVPGRMFDLPDC